MSRKDEEFLGKRGLTEFEQRLAGWETNDDDTHDTVHLHFDALGKSFFHWGDVADEGRRLFAIMFNELIEEHSASEAILLGVAAAAYSLAIDKVASAMCVSPGSVEIALEAETPQGAEAFARDCIAAESRRPGKH